jgi:hypothetical protein
VRCAEELGSLQNHLVNMLITVILGSRARVGVKVENVHNMRFCVLEWVYTSRMKNTQHQKDLFYERMHSIMEQDRERILAKKPMEKDKRKKVVDPEFGKKVGGDRLYDPPRLRTYLKKKLIDNPVGNYAKNKEAGRQPTLYQRGVVKAFDARNNIAKRMMRNKTVFDKTLRGGTRTAQWLKRKTGDIIGKERMRALRVSAQRRLSGGPKI